jgi:hypothetical protein
MARKNEPSTEQRDRSSLPRPVKVVETHNKPIEDFANGQAQFFDKLDATSQRWSERIQSEATLASEFASKLTVARSIPEAVAACQDWASRRFEMMAEDRDHLFADYQVFMEAGAHFLWNIWQWNSSAVSAQLQGAGAAPLASSAASQK